MDWPQYIPERNKKEILTELSELNKRASNLRSELVNASAYEYHIALAQFFTEYDESSPPAVKLKLANNWKNHHHPTGRFCEEPVIVDVTEKPTTWSQRDIGLAVTVRVGNNPLLTSTGSFSAKQTARFLLTTGNVSSLTTGKVNATRMLEIAQQELYPAIWKRLVRRYVREHQSRWPQVQHRS